MIYLEKTNPLHPDNFFNLLPKLNYPLYLAGMINESDKNMVAIVGTRKPTLYGIQAAKEIAKAAVSAGFTVVSGLARGIDTEAHRAALMFGGRTIAVLGTGLDKIYPEENIGLAEDIKRNGAIISQFPPDTPPLRRNFPLRNYTVALISSIVVVVEAPLKSGSLITAKMALDAGKKVFVLPGRINEENMAGNMQFLKDYKDRKNLFMLHDIKELFSDELKEIALKEVSSQIPQNLDSSESKIFELLMKRSDGVVFDEIVRETDFSAAELPGILLGLILKNIVEEHPGKIYVLKKEQ